MGYSLKSVVEVCNEFELLQHFNQQYKHNTEKLILHMEVMPMKTALQCTAPGQVL